MNEYREEIRSGTVVTYNDRQEILCQKCTDIALNEGDENGEEPTKARFSDSPSSHSAEGGGRQVIL